MPDLTLASTVLSFIPVYKPYVWGGSNLPARLGRNNAPMLDRYAESWELSDHPDGMSVADSSPFEGRPLSQLVRDHGRDLIGAAMDGFPLLVKVLDAADRLSVQVHPDEQSAKLHGGEPKTECWFILDAAPGASVWAGLKPGIDEPTFRQALQNGTVETLLHAVPVRAGDLLFIPGGRVHAIGKGCLILEVQQRSNTTYRVFDWNRTGPDGKTRDLHVEQAMRTIRWDDSGSPLTAPGDWIRDGGGRRRTRLACPFFMLDEWALEGPVDIRHDGSSFHAWHGISGSWRIEPESGPAREWPSGVTALVPACMRRYRLVPLTADARLLRIALP